MKRKANAVLLYLLWQALTTTFLTKTTPIRLFFNKSIYGNGYIKQLKGCSTYLID